MKKQKLTINKSILSKLDKIELSTVRGGSVPDDSSTSSSINTKFTKITSCCQILGD